MASLMVMMLMSALLVGFTTMVMSDQRFRGIDKDRNRAYYAAQSGLEKLTVDLGNLSLTNVAPTRGKSPTWRTIRRRFPTSRSRRRRHSTRTA